MSSSIKEDGKRLLVIDGHNTVWKQWIDAYNWDKEKTFPIHQRLTSGHFNEKCDKMKNKLAEEVLDSRMLELMISFGKIHKGSNPVQGPIKLLTLTTKLVEFVMCSRLISSLSHPLITQLEEVATFFLEWEKSVTDKSLMIKETREDLQFYIAGINELIRCCHNFGFDVCPASINSDILENMFSMQRGIFHGYNTNPNYFQYSYGVNGIILGQKSISQKSNPFKRTTSSELIISMPYKKLCIRQKKSIEQFHNMAPTLVTRLPD